MSLLKARIRRSNEAGYTLLIVVFLVATMIIAAAAAAPSVLTEGRREKEAEMIWRGEQYERAIGLYFKKFGKYPTKVEDLTRVTNGVRFLREAYKDPMNKEDGAWRFIYIGPNGQLIGSLKQTSLLQNSLGMNFGSSNPFGSFQQPGAPGQGNITTGAGGAPGATGVAGAFGQPAGGQPGGSASAANPLESQPQPLDGTIIGGNIAGVGSKIKKPSLRIYMGGDNYQQWEFIWNPIGQVALPGQAPANPNANPTGAPNATNPNGANPNGAAPNGANPNGGNPNAPAPTGTDGQQPPPTQQPPTQ